MLESSVYIFIYVLLCTEFLPMRNAKEMESSYIYNGNFTWKESKRKCTMIGLNDKVNMMSESVTAWVDVAAVYTPWVEYKGCFTFSNTNVLEMTTYRSENLFLLCLEKCTEYQFFGLQDSTCACLKSADTISSEFVERLCQQTSIKRCNGDTNALCGSNIKDFVMYEKVDLANYSGVGNCMTVKFRNGKYYQPTHCNNLYFHVCQESYNRDIFSTAPVENAIWIQGYQSCKQPSIMASYHTIQNIKFNLDKVYWIGSIRRYKEKHPPGPDPKFCVAATILQDGKITRSVRSCTDHLPALCKVKATPGGMKNTNKNQDLGTQSVTVIVLSVTLSIVILIFIGLCTRLHINRHSGSVENQTAASPERPDVVYAQVNKLNRKSSGSNETGRNIQTTSYDVYDHMERTCRPRDLEESNYDTMMNIEINEENEDIYDRTIESGERKMIVEDNAEYSHVEIGDGTYAI